MKKLSFLFIGFVAFLYSCDIGNKIVKLSNITENSIDFALVLYYMSADGKDTLKVRWYLKADTVIQGYPCSADHWLTFNKNWELTQFVLSKPYELAGTILPEKTLIIIGEINSGNMAGAYYTLYFPGKLNIQGYWCMGQTYSNYEDVHSDGTYLYKSGKLLYFKPDGIIEIDGIKCKPHSFHGHVFLYESGRLKRCTLAENQTINGILYKANTIVMFDENGNVSDIR
jgi:hypothetical protein